MADLADKIGYRVVAVVCQLVGERVTVQNIRAHDIAVALSDVVLVCMPDTDEAGARAVVDRVQRAVCKTVHPRLEIKAEIFRITQIDQLSDIAP